MNKSDLEKTLRKWEAPAQPEEYWEMLPRRVLSRLRTAPSREPVGRLWLPRLAWSAGCALVCVALGLAMWHWRGNSASITSADLLQNQKVLREVLTLFPHRVRAIIQDERGLQLVLSDQPDVPSSEPLWIKICDKSRCRSAITFSGQQVQLAGEQFEVLEDARGQVTLLSNRFLWSSGDPSNPQSELRIQARSLAGVL